MTLCATREDGPHVYEIVAERRTREPWSIAYTEHAPTVDPRPAAYSEHKVYGLSTHRRAHATFTHAATHVLNRLASFNIQSTIQKHEHAPSLWLSAQWEKAHQSHREAVWNALPDNLADQAQGDPSAHITRDDVEFLVQRTQEPFSNGIAEVRAAIRFLAIIGEEELISRDVVTPHIVAMLDSQHPGIRAAAAEACWQIGDRTALPGLRRAFQREAQEHVRVVMERVLQILE